MKVTVNDHSFLRVDVRSGMDSKDEARIRRKGRSKNQNVFPLEIFKTHIYVYNEDQRFRAFKRVSALPWSLLWCNIQLKRALILIYAVTPRFKLEIFHELVLSRTSRKQNSRMDLVLGNATIAFQKVWKIMLQSSLTVLLLLFLDWDSFYSFFRGKFLSHRAKQFPKFLHNDWIWSYGPFYFVSLL